MSDHTEITVRAYDKNAAAYTERFRDYVPYEEERERFIRLLDPESRVLDLGCGPGLNAAAFVGAGHRVTGIDLSAGMLAEARVQCPAGEFVQADLVALPEMDPFDAVFASFCIVHLDNSGCDVFVDRLPTLVKPGGLLYISFMDGKAPGLEKTSFSRDEIFFNYYNRDSIKKRFIEMGCSLEYENCQGFQEADGGVTDEFFLIFKMI